MKINNTTAPVDVPAFDWIESESVKQIKQSVTKTTFSSFVGMVVLLTLLYPYTARNLLWTWAALHGFVFSARFIYFSRDNKNITLNKYYSILVMSAGLIWGSTIYLLFNEDQSRIEAIALCVIIIYGMVSTINLSQHLRSVKSFLIGYGTGIIGALFGNIIFHNEGVLSAINVMSLIVTFLFLFILYKFSIRLNISHDNTLELQYRNNLLIGSLKIEKQAAVDAIEIKNRFMASAAHDMRQPVLALDLYTDMLVDDPEALPAILPKIAGATKSVIVMFDALFDLARISMNQLTPEKTYFNIQGMIDDLSMQYQPIAKAKGLVLRVRNYPSDCGVKDDPILLKRIFSNLLSNAIKYTDHGGILLVFRYCEKRGLRIEVWDTGLGISPDEQQAVFSEFYKNPENAGTTDGFGLGLAIVAQLCDLLGHKLTMKSRRGRGTVVSVRLSDAVLIA